MGYLGDSLLTAFELILGLDRDVRMAVWTSLYTSGCSIVIAALFGIPAGLWLGLRRFRGRQLLITLLNTMMAMPTVVVGLLLFGLLSRQGPLGPLGLLFTALTLGASRWQAAIKLLGEVRFGVMAAVIAGFGRVIAEVGVAMMLGGNIRNSTRTMTTAIALETSKGEFAFGLALGVILLAVALVVNLFLNALQQR